MTPKRMLTGLACCVVLSSGAGTAMLAQNTTRDLSKLRALSKSEIETLIAKKLAVKNGPMSKLGTNLAELQTEYQEFNARGSRSLGKQFRSGNPLIKVSDQERVYIEAVAVGDTKALLSDLTALGLKNPTTFGRFVSGSLPVSSLVRAAGLTSLHSADVPAYITRVGAVTSQGDASMHADDLRARKGVDGSGVTVGALSDSYDCLGGAAAQVASGDLPAGVIVVDDLSPAECAASGAIDETRALIEIVHDVAPGAGAAVHAARGQANFAQAILDFANVYGAKVIVDDIAFFAEPMFQDGIIAQAVDQVRSQGVNYFSSAGNDERNAYQSKFRNSGEVGLFGGIRHDFDPGPGVDTLQNVTLQTGVTIIAFQWSDPFFSVSGAPGAATDMDILVYLNGVFTGIGSANINVGGDPVEVFAIGNGGPPIQVQLGLELFEGPEPKLMKYIYFFDNMTVDEFDTASGTVFGHPNAAGALAVGAAFYQETPEFGQSPPLIEPFSSAGHTPILFKTNGSPTLRLRLKPDLTAPDGTDSTFFPPFPGQDVDGNGFPNFFGTSAAAPHAAGVAALLLDINHHLSPTLIEILLKLTAVDMNDPATPYFDFSFDFATGFGLIHADRAGRLVF